MNGALALPPVCQCPRCGHEFKVSACVNGDSLLRHPGAISICVYCGSVNRLKETLSLEALDESELGKLNGETRALIDRVQAEINLLWTRRAQGPDGGKA